ncbi:mucin-12-like [Hypomesus transpacificus]|uniref:mucin-12-like n=1 Tax=Hypomesus transpacificus TaxID=137520 RepID=UPI001F0751EF|nr:mucin-12-like [Hypomesus transpacificus]
MDSTPEPSPTTGEMKAATEILETERTEETLTTSKSMDEISSTTIRTVTEMTTETENEPDVGLLGSTSSAEILTTEHMDQTEYPLTKSVEEASPTTKNPETGGLQMTPTVEKGESTHITEYIEKPENVLTGSTPEASTTTVNMRTELPGDLGSPSTTKIIPETEMTVETTVEDKPTDALAESTPTAERLETDHPDETTFPTAQSTDETSQTTKNSDEVTEGLDISSTIEHTLNTEPDMLQTESPQSPTTEHARTELEDWESPSTTSIVQPSTATENLETEGTEETQMPTKSVDDVSLTTAGPEMKTTVENTMANKPTDVFAEPTTAAERLETEHFVETVFPPTQCTDETSQTTKNPETLTEGIDITHTTEHLHTTEHTKEPEHPQMDSTPDPSPTTGDMKAATEILETECTEETLTTSKSMDEISSITIRTVTEMTMETENEPDVGLLGSTSSAEILTTEHMDQTEYPLTKSVEEASPTTKNPETEGLQMTPTVEKGESTHITEYIEKPENVLTGSTPEASTTTVNMRTELPGDLGSPSTTRIIPETEMTVETTVEDKPTDALAESTPTAERLQTEHPDETAFPTAHSTDETSQTTKTTDEVTEGLDISSTIEHTLNPEPDILQTESPQSPTTEHVRTELEDWESPSTTSVVQPSTATENLETECTEETQMPTKSVDDVSLTTAGPEMKTTAENKPTGVLAEPTTAESLKTEQITPTECVSKLTDVYTTVENQELDTPKETSSMTTETALIPMSTPDIQETGSQHQTESPHSPSVGAHQPESVFTKEIKIHTTETVPTALTESSKTEKVYTGIRAKYSPTTESPETMTTEEAKKIVTKHPEATENPLIATDGEHGLVLPGCTGLIHRTEAGMRRCAQRWSFEVGKRLKQTQFPAEAMSPILDRAVPGEGQSHSSGPTGMSSPGTGALTVSEGDTGHKALPAERNAQRTDHKSNPVGDNDNDHFYYFNGKLKKVHNYFDPKESGALNSYKSPLSHKKRNLSEGKKDHLDSKHQLKGHSQKNKTALYSSEMMSRDKRDVTTFRNQASDEASNNHPPAPSASVIKTHAEGNTVSRKIQMKITNANLAAGREKNVEEQQQDRDRGRSRSRICQGLIHHGGSVLYCILKTLQSKAPIYDVSDSASQKVTGFNQIWTTGADVHDLIPFPSEKE